MRSISVRAYSFAGTLSPKELAPMLEKASSTVRSTKTQVIADCGGESFILAYDFGAIAFVGVDDATRDMVMDAVKQRVGPEPHPPLEEQATITVAPDEKPTVKFDEVVVRELDRKVVELVALVVSQSAAMEYYEEDVDQILARLNKVSESLAQTGKLSARPKELLKFIGSGMSVHNQVIYTLALLDTPQLAWDNEALDRVYSGLRTQFEIADRFRALDLKLRMIQDNFELFVDLTQERRNYVLELTVTALVAVEVVLFVYEIFYRHV
ncbi:MAG TPA: RMD1 family protein [Polyangiaceae bacterium]|nr:RMD1 family protein [Polyangiaceae bacterium]